MHDLVGIDLALSEVYGLVDKLLQQYPTEVFHKIDPEQAYYYRGQANAYDAVLGALLELKQKTLQETDAALENQYGGNHDNTTTSLPTSNR